MIGKKSNNYFEEFVKLIDFSCKSSKALLNIINSYDIKNLEKQRISMHKIEHNADIEKHNLINKLQKEFITPIEREDIITITEVIDDLTDYIEDIVICMYMYNIHSLRKEIFSFTKVIDKSCDSLKQLFIEFQNYKKSTKINDLIITINKYEEDADKIYVDASKTLYAYTKEPIEIMKWNEIFDRLEKCCDSCEKIANTIENIIMKNT